MTAREFGEWKVFLFNEQLDPAHDRLRHAQQLAAAMNGPVTRPGGRLMSAGELIGDNPWKLPSHVKPVIDVASQVEAMNRGMGL